MFFFTSHSLCLLKNVQLGVAAKLTVQWRDRLSICPCQQDGDLFCGAP